MRVRCDRQLSPFRSRYTATSWVLGSWFSYTEPRRRQESEEDEEEEEEELAPWILNSTGIGRNYVDGWYITRGSFRSPGANHYCSSTGRAAVARSLWARLPASVGTSRDVVFLNLYGLYFCPCEYRSRRVLAG